MKPAVALASCVLFAASLTWSTSDGFPGEKPALDELTLIISGNASGHLSPCGCTKPMSGGLKRLATLVRQYKAHGNVLWLDTGSISENGNRQNQMKVEAYSEVLGNLKVDVVAFSGNDALVGMSALSAGKALSKAIWIGDPFGLPAQVITPSTTKKNLTFKTVPGKNLVQVSSKKSSIEVYQTDGTANVSGKRMTPGSHLRGILVVKFRNGQFLSAKALSLESKIADDPAAEKIYRSYLRRVSQANLIDQLPRSDEEEFVGSKKCASCHQEAGKVHFASAHSHAFQTLVKEGHSRDPDCVSCHVVGVNSSKGFWADKTPEFEEVGCESCHGGGVSHSAEPERFKMPKVGEQKCVTCHTPSNSPTFNFLTYWSKIQHKK